MDTSYPVRDIGQSTHSSNYHRRDNRPIGVCIHTTSGVNSVAYLQADKRATNNVATADYLIDRQGTRYKLVPDGNYAYHVGKARWGAFTNDLDRISEMYIGIELENLDNGLCTWQQHDSLAELITGELMNKWLWAYPFDIVGHYELATPIGRRSDPLGFDWGFFWGYITARMGFVQREK